MVPLSFETGSFFRFILISLFIASESVSAQIAVTSKVLDGTSKEEIPYVNVYYPKGATGVITDLSGAFRLSVNAPDDSLFISAVGYKRLKLSAAEIGESILLNRDISEMKTAVIRPADDRYYFQCLDSCRKYPRIFKGEARSVFHQTTAVDSVIVEQLDAYYNAVCNGYELEKLDLKTGKFGLKPHHSNFFISYENAKAITLLPALRKPDYFPLQPLCMSVDQMKKHYFVEVQREYYNEDGDRMLKLHCIPRDKSGAFFFATYTLNRSKGFIAEIELKGKTGHHHPFVPYAGDSLRSIEWNIHKAFQLEKDTLCLRQINFTYSAEYLRLRKTQPDDAFTARTQAILYIYNRQSPFLLPAFNFGTYNPDDFHRMNVYGYNDFFWMHHREFQLTDQQQAIPFYTDPAVVLSQQVFSAASLGRSGLFEHPYLHWSRKRFRIRQAVSDTSKKYNPRIAEREQYELSVQLVAELDTVDGLHRLRTAVVVDPFQSYWRVPEDSLTMPFVNILFDYCEIKRRTLQEKYGQRTDRNVLKEIQSEFYNWFRSFSETYYRDVQRGHTISALEKYAAVVEKELVIRNFHAEPSDVPEQD